jgi:hypothetical protein
MKNVSIFLLLFWGVALTAGKCDTDDSVDADSSDDLCSHIDELCGTNVLYDSRSACESDMNSMESCRRKCAAAQSTCETVDQCLWWNIGYEGAADKYCSSDVSGDSDTGDYTYDTSGDVTFEQCVSENCSFEYSICDANIDCTSIFDDCLQGCSTDECINTCAQSFYYDGIDDFNNLWSCMVLYCN